MLSIYHCPYHYIDDMYEAVNEQKGKEVAWQQQQSFSSKTLKICHPALHSFLAV